MKQIALIASILLITGCATQNRETYGEYYIVKEDGVYWSRFTRLAQQRIDTKVETIDKQSFSVLPNPIYGKDKDYVYHKAVPMPLADAESFSPLSEKVGKDKNNVFLTGEIIPGADSASFQIVNDSLMDTYAKDKNSYYFNYTKFKPCDEASITFEKGFIQTWAKDKNCVFYNGLKIEGADIASHKMMLVGYSKDKNRVYYENKPLNGADVATFDFVDGSPRDKNYCYKHGSIAQCPENSKKLTDMSEKELNDSASDMAMSMLQDDRNKEATALLAIPKTTADIVKKYGNLVLTPNDVKNINLRNLKPGFNYTLINRVEKTFTSFYPRKDAITYKLRSINGNSAEFDVIHPKNFGYLKQTHRLDGVITSAPYIISYPSSRTYFPSGNCEYQIGSCDFTTQSSAESLPIKFKQIASFNAGVWTYYTTTQTGKKRISIYIYDKNGFPLYMSSYVDNSLSYEYERRE